MGDILKLPQPIFLLSPDALALDQRYQILKHSDGLVRKSPLMTRMIRPSHPCLAQLLVPYQKSANFPLTVSTLLKQFWNAADVNEYVILLVLVNSGPGMSNYPSQTFTVVLLCDRRGFCDAAYCVPGRSTLQAQEGRLEVSNVAMCFLRYLLRLASPCTAAFTMRLACPARCTGRRGQVLDVDEHSSNSTKLKISLYIKVKLPASRTLCS